LGKVLKVLDSKAMKKVIQTFTNKEISKPEKNSKTKYVFVVGGVISGVYNTSHGVSAIAQPAPRGIRGRSRK
jgi:hypothetical protein